VPELISLMESVNGSGFEASVITTFNAYLPFYEEVILRQLIASGCRHNSVLLDAAQLSQSLDSISLRPTGAGYDYTMVPMRSNGAFHPKILLMVGPKKATVCIGSHNLTISGFGLNRETTCRLHWGGKAEDASADITRAAWHAIKHWLKADSTGIPRPILQNVLAVEEIAPWIRANPKDHPDCRFLYQGNGTDSLWDQLKKDCPRSVKRITVVGAFFDARCDFLKQLQSEFPSAKMQIAIEPETVFLLKQGVSRVEASWRDATALTEKSGYLHAKLLFLDTGGRGDVLVLGSANPSAPAWGISRVDRNEEALIAWFGPRARELAEALGLDAIKELPALDKGDLKRIEANNADRSSPPAIDNRSYGIAVITGDAVEFSQTSLRADPQSVALLDDRSCELAAHLEMSKKGDLFSVQLPALLLDQVRFIRIAYRRGPETLLICHHEQRRTAAARTGRQAQLRQALASLEGDPSNLADLIAAVQKVVFASDARAMKPPPPMSGKRGPKSNTETLTSLEGSASSDTQMKARPRIAEGDLGYLLHVLIHELGQSIPAHPATAEVDSRTEEEQVDTDDETQPIPAATLMDDAKLVDIVGRKVATLVNRMIKVLDATSTSADMALTAVAQLTAVLCTLRSLRQLDRQDRWRRTGKSLVPEDYRYRLFQGVLHHVIGGSHPLLKHPEVLDANHSMEVVNLRGLLIWLAWECKCRVDRPFALGDEMETRDENVLDRAALLELIVPVIPDADAMNAAEKSIQLAANARQTLTAAQWIQTHFAWGRRVVKAASASGQATPLGARPPAMGTVVALTTASGRSLHIVAGHSGAAIILADLSSDSGEREFLPNRLVRIVGP
jgi:hypothetical protein